MIGVSLTLQTNSKRSAVSTQVRDGIATTPLPSIITPSKSSTRSTMTTLTPLYLTFHIHCDHADVSATYGRGYPIITHTLKPIPVDYFCLPLTPEQIEILDPKIGFARALKLIIDDHLPLHLSAAIQCYQYYKSIQ